MCIWDVYMGIYMGGVGSLNPMLLWCWYGVATISRLLEIIGLFCRILSLLWVSFAKETYHFKEPTNRSHPITYKNPRMQHRRAMGWLRLVGSLKK